METLYSELQKLQELLHKLQVLSLKKMKDSDIELKRIYDTGTLSFSNSFCKISDLDHDKTSKGNSTSEYYKLKIAEMADFLELSTQQKPSKTFKTSSDLSQLDDSCIF